MMEPYVIHFAPLQGYTDSVYREAHAQIFGGVETYYTPFVRLEKTGFRNKELRDLVPEANTSASLVPQMIAVSPEEFRRIAGLFRVSGYRHADINLGCPFPMQARQHRGAGILPYPDEVKVLLETIFEFPEIQFSVKLRLGWDSPEEAQALLPFLNGLPLTHLTLHPRIGTQQYKGKTDLSAFSRFYDSCTLPLFYNGDIRTLPDIRSLTGRFPRLKGIMIGRGLLSSPWLATEYISDTPLTAQEKIDLTVSGLFFPSGGRRTPGTRQDEDPLGLPVAGCRETAPEKNIEKFPVGRLSRGSAEFDLRHLDHCRAMIRMNSLI